MSSQKMIKRHIDACAWYIRGSINGGTIYVCGMIDGQRYRISTRKYATQETPKWIAENAAWAASQ